MKIINIETFPIGFKYPRPFHNSVQEFKLRTTTLVKISSDSGIVGWGEASYGPPGGISKIIQDYIAPRLLGKNPFNIEFIWHQLQNPKGTPIGAIAGVDSALWDLKAKALKVPLYDLLGGKFIDEITPYASGFFFSEDNPDSTEYLEKEAESILNKGFKAVKMKIGFGVDRDIKRMKKMREIIGDNIQLMVDANQAYDYRTCIQLNPIFQDMNISYLEEPLPWCSFTGYKEIKKKMSIPIAGGEAENSYQGFIEAIKNRIVDIIQPDISISGGITILKKLAILCEAFHIEFLPHSFGTLLCLPATIQLMASLSNYQSWTLFPKSIFMEWGIKPNDMAKDLLTVPLEIDNGVYKIPDQVSLGVDINEEAIKHYRL